MRTVTREHVRAAPSEEQSTRLANLCRELVEKDRRIAELEKDISREKSARNRMIHRDLPDYMREIGQDRVGLPDMKVDLALAPFYHANIAADWPEEDRQRAFDHLVERGDGDLIKVVLSYNFRREQLDDAKRLIGLIEAAAVRTEPVIDLPDPVVGMKVDWNTLTAFVREQHEAGKLTQADRDVLKPEIGWKVKVTERKD